MKKLITYHLLMFLAVSTIPTNSYCAQPTPSETFISGFTLGVITYVCIRGVYSLTNASSEATTRMRAADRRLASERSRTEQTRRAADRRLAEQIRISEDMITDATGLERTRTRTQQAHRNGDHQRTQTLLAEELLEDLDPRMQQLAREGRLSHTSFLQAMVAQDLLRNT